MIALARPWQYSFFIHGMLAATLVGGLCGLIGAYVVLRHMSYIGHGLSHAIFGGAVVSYVLQWNFYIGAGLYGFIAALLINATARKRQIGADAAIGVITTASFAFGVALISRVRHFTKNFEAALFGNILGVTTGDLWVIAAVALLTVIAIFFSYKQLLFTTFDSEVAPIYGVPTHKIETLFALILAATLIASMQVMGVTLIAAALVIPAVIARLLTDSFAKLLVLTTLIGAGCGFTGMYTSFYVDVASGATIVLTAAALFTIVIAITLLRQQRSGLKAGLAKQRAMVTSGDPHLFD
ncbi:MAG: metal ABC transporter permease [Herpetosiphon sp.]